MASPPIPAYKVGFLQACLDANVLSFGTYTLKSGRQSPYFFNAGLFLNDASLFSVIQTAYAQSLIEHASTNPSFSFDVLFGPAYKGIPLSAATFGELARLDKGRFGHIGCAFNRKEVKDHGDGGSLVGAPLRGKRVMVIDDVLTAGTAIREAIDIIKTQGGELAGVIVALDRMEKMPAQSGEDEAAPRMSAIGQVRKEYGVPVLSIVTLDDLIGRLREVGSDEDMKRVEEYKRMYGTGS
ncbi:orotate phosphoribosyltransferase [Lambiella insularis]|nr:orotate phosphoribosyltransferase [Lambiella insularis]